MGIRETVQDEIQCMQCGAVRTAVFSDEPEPPISKQTCDICGEDTDHRLVDIEVRGRMSEGLNAVGLNRDIYEDITYVLDTYGSQSRRDLYQRLGSEYPERDISKTISIMLMEGLLFLRRDDSELYLPHMIIKGMRDEVT